MIYGDNNQRMVFELIAGIHLKTRRRINSMLKGYGITYSQFGALLAIVTGAKIEQGMNQSLLAKALETDTTNAMVICDGLEKKQLIQRKPFAQDRRVNHLIATPSGEELIHKILPDIETLFRPFSEVLDDIETEKLVFLLEKLYLHVKESEREK
ncbi:MAG TPA: hypothetical protein DIW48_08580 [Sphaerochaeta sp.]|nr:MAG: hypothetical protein A2Y31_07915 [Spirochaetes bacterium GWC2_52_13]HCG64554.1 hypothetical protein [Sphaerochaeta sp.]HCS36719.1 hypothetical protein [Sphaerochaeta sp.]